MPKRDESSTRSKILDAAAQMISEAGSSNLRIGEVAERAAVGPPTIYYYFASREALIAAAQAQRLVDYINLDLPYVEKIQAALEARDVEAYQVAATKLDPTYWGSGATQVSWQILEILADLRRNDAMRDEVGELVRETLKQRADLFKMTQEVGWADGTIDPMAWIIYLFGVALGQVLGDLHPDLKVNPEVGEKLRSRMHGSAFTSLAGAPAFAEVPEKS